MPRSGGSRQHNGPQEATAPSPPPPALPRRPHRDAVAPSGGYRASGLDRGVPGGQGPRGAVLGGVWANRSDVFRREPGQPWPSRGKGKRYSPVEERFWAPRGIEGTPQHPRAALPDTGTVLIWCAKDLPCNKSSLKRNKPYLQVGCFCFFFLRPKFPKS